VRRDGALRSSDEIRGMDLISLALGLGSFALFLGLVKGLEKV
jgi:hypothetical protein